MKIYILRHEDRTQDATFFSPLTKNGLENANKLIDTLKKLNIKSIYSSPFIRTLHTIYPFAKNNELTIKIDYGLSEIKSDYLIPKNSHAIRLPEYLNEPFLISSDYRSSVEAEDLKFPELDKYLSQRYAYVKNRCFTCDLCNVFTAGSKQSLGAHKRSCCKKYHNSNGMNNK
jgi:hypothetical protein